MEEVTKQVEEEIVAGIFSQLNGLSFADVKSIGIERSLPVKSSDGTWAYRFTVKIRFEGDET